MVKPKPLLFGKFCLLERISVGGMAEVFRAKPMDAPGFDKFLAIKRILPNLAEDEDFIEMFIDEARITVQLNHGNICQIYELGRLHESHYIVMEFISGRDILAIQNRLRKERRIMSVGQAAFLCRQIAMGLDYAHRKTDPEGNPLNIIHRDISPQNVLVSYSGEVKVIDFGIAKAANKSNKTQVGVLKGKFGYMSPEQVRGFPLDQRSDVFALGTLFHEMLTCRRLFYGESDFATLEKVRKADVQPPSSLNPNVPPEIDRIVMKALAAEVDDRYEWCSDLAADLDAFLAKLKPAYTERTLEAWMQKMFAERVEAEQEKRRVFAQFQTPQDVQAYNEKLRQEMAAKMGLPEDYDGKDKDQITEEATQIWDTSKGLPGSNLPPTEEATLQDSPEIREAATQIVQNINDLLPDYPPRPPAPNPMPPGPAMNHMPPGPMYEGSHQPSFIPPPPAAGGIGKLGVVLIVFFVIASLGIVGAVGYVFLDLGGATVAASQIKVRTEPVQDVEILINGKLVSTRSPHVEMGLAPGKYTLSVKHPDYQPATKIVTVQNGSNSDLTLQLKPKPVGKGFLTLKVDPSEAEIYVDGKQVPGSKASLMELGDRKEHLVEARLDGYFVSEMRLEVIDGQKIEKSLRLRKLEGTIDLKSTPSGAKVYLNGTKVGTTPMSLPRLDPREVHDLQLRAPGYSAWKKKVAFTKSHRKNFSAKLKKKGAAPAAPDTFGYLVAPQGDSWWRVIIDGWDSGLTTPITAKSKLALPVGKHTVTLKRGTTEHDYKIDVQEGKTVKLDPGPAFKWTPPR